MSFVDQSKALERERRVRALLTRLSTLTEDELKKLDRLLGIQVMINDAINNSGFPIVKEENSDEVKNNIKILLSGRIETVRSNLTQILKYTPTDDDINELIKIRNAFGSDFIGSIKKIANTIDQIQGGISAFIKSIETGITQVIKQVSDEIQNAINESEKEVKKAINDLIPDINDIIDKKTLATLKSTVNDVQAIINNPLILLPKLANLFADDLDDKIKKIDEELAKISKENQEAARPQSNSNITIENRQAIETVVTNQAYAPASAPDPVNIDGSPQQTVPNNPPTEAPIQTSRLLGPGRIAYIVAEEKAIRADEWPSKNNVYKYMTQQQIIQYETETGIRP